MNGAPYEELTEIGPNGPRWTGKVNLATELLYQPLHWKKARRVFVNSMSDLFHEDVPFEFIDKVFLVAGLARQHTFQILTKRPERMLQYCAALETRDRLIHNYVKLTEGIPGTCLTLRETGDALSGIRLPNVWLGVSVEDQKTANERIPLLLQTPAAVRFVSYEPVLAPVNFSRWLHAFEISRDGDGNDLGSASGGSGISWLIAGGESGSQARPMQPEWVRSVRDQCIAAGVPFFFKQWGEYLHRDAMTDQQFALIAASDNFANGSQEFFRLGKKVAGRLLDGREWNEYPG